MVRTKSEIKIKLKTWIQNRDSPFTTGQAQAEMRKEATNILLTPNRLSKFIRATEAAEFDPKHKQWNVRLSPLKRQKVKE